MVRPMLAAPHGMDPWLILLLALALDAVVGDPRWLYRAVPHPVALMGRLIEAGDARLNDPAAPRRARLAWGAALSAALVGGAAILGWGVERGLAGLPGGWTIEAVLASTLIAGRGLFDHVRAVADALERDLGAARAAVAHIVGRDPNALDPAGVARAAAESAAENFADGVVAPVVWFALFGLGGLAAYKALNTLDSMIGHRTTRHEAFGKAAARADDVANWLPARLAGLLIVVAAAVLPEANGARAWRAMGRDARRHRSPNAGWPEAALAGALDLALAGPRRYGGETVADAWMGTGRADLDAADLRRVLRLYAGAWAVLAGAVAAIVLA